MKEKGGGGSGEEKGGSGASQGGTESDAQGEEEEKRLVYRFGYQSASSDSQSMKNCIAVLGVFQWLLCALSLFSKIRISIMLATNTLGIELERYKRLRGTGKGSSSSKGQSDTSSRVKRNEKSVHAKDDLKATLLRVGSNCRRFTKRAYRTLMWFVSKPTAIRSYFEYFWAFWDCIKWVLICSVFAITTVGPVIGWDAASYFFFGFISTPDQDYSSYHVPGAFFFVIMIFGLSTIFNVCKVYCQRNEYNSVWSPAFNYITLYRAVRHCAHVCTNLVI